MDDKGSLVCPICGRSGLNSMLSHVTKKHHMSKEEFISQYPDCKLVTSYYSSIAAKGGSAGLATQRKDPEAYRRSRVKSHVTRKELYGDEYNKNFLDKAHANASERMKHQWSNPEYYEARSIQMKHQHEQGLTDIIMKSIKGNHIQYYSVSMNQLIYLRSSWELKVAQWLDDHELEYIYEGLSFQYIHPIDGTVHKYYPDFYLPEYNLILEVKPKSFINNLVNVAKANSVPSEYKYRFITEDDLNNLDSITL